MERVLHEGFACGALEDGLLLGWIGGLPQYDGRVWELHPLVVRRDRRLRGVGRALVAAFEDEARRRGALTLTLGTDDDGGQTSVAGVDLYGANVSLHSSPSAHASPSPTASTRSCSRKRSRPG